MRENRVVSNLAGDAVLLRGVSGRLRAHPAAPIEQMELGRDGQGAVLGEGKLRHLTIRE